MKKILFCVLILLISVNVFAADVDINQLDIKQLTEMANNGDAEAQCRLGYIYFYDVRVDIDEKQAIYWYTKAAEQGFAAAQVELGISYYYGCGVSINPKQGVYWFQKAAEQGDTLAQALLGNDFTIGRGGSQNYQLAYMWYSIGLSLTTEVGEAESFREALKNIEFRLTKAEIAEAEQMAAEWLEKHQ